MTLGRRPETALRVVSFVVARQRLKAALAGGLFRRTRPHLTLAVG